MAAMPPPDPILGPIHSPKLLIISTVPTEMPFFTLNLLVKIHSPFDGPVYYYTGGASGNMPGSSVSNQILTFCEVCVYCFLFFKKVYGGVFTKLEAI